MKKLQILGAGCAKCDDLLRNTQMAAKEMGLACSIEKVTELSEIMKFGVMMTPALVVDGVVKLVGKSSDVDSIKKLLT
jgi:small redox-active disulfide protein 2